MSGSNTVWGEFPRIVLSINGVERAYTMNEAAQLWNNGHERAQVTGSILEVDLTVRDIRKDELADLKKFAARM